MVVKCVGKSRHSQGHGLPRLQHCAHWGVVWHTTWDTHGTGRGTAARGRLCAYGVQRHGGSMVNRVEAHLVLSRYIQREADQSRVK